MKRTCLAFAVLAGVSLCACGKKQPENIPQPQAGDVAVEASTAPAVEQNPLKAGANYLKTTVGQVEKAKAAAAVYEGAAAEHFKGTDVDDAGGN